MMPVPLLMLETNMSNTHETKAILFIGVWSLRVELLTSMSRLHVLPVYLLPQTRI